MTNTSNRLDDKTWYEISDRVTQYLHVSGISDADYDAYEACVIAICDRFCSSMEEWESYRPGPRPVQPVKPAFVKVNRDHSMKLVNWIRRNQRPAFVAFHAN